MQGYICYWYSCNTSRFSVFEFDLWEHVRLVQPVPLNNRKKRRKKKKRFLMKCTVQPHVLSAFMTSQSWSKWQRSGPCLREVQTSFFSKQNHDSTERRCKCVFCCIPVKYGLLQQLFVGYEKATETTESPEHCCMNSHSKEEVRSRHSHSPRATLAPCWN